MADAIINDDALELGPANLYVSEKVRASLTTATGSGENLTFKARKPGADGNLISVEFVEDGSNTALSVVVTDQAILVNLETDGSGNSVSTADEVKDAVNNSFAAFSLVYAVRATTADGAGVISADMAATFLTGGSDTETERFLGGLGEATAVNIAASAAPITAHLTGTQPRDKVISGGSFQFAIPFKEMTLDNFALAFPNAILIEGAGGFRRLDFAVRIGESLRKSRGTKLILRKVIGGVESTDPDDILTVPEASPVDAQVSLAFSPTEQRILAATFEAWPDSRGRVAFFGTETL